MPGLVSHYTKLEVSDDGSTFVEIANVRSFPQMKAEPEMVDTSVVNMPNGTSSPGQSKPQALKFLAAYGSETPGESAQAAGTNYGKCKANEGSTKKYRLVYPDGSGYLCDAKIWVGSPEAFTGANNPLEFPIILYPQGKITDIANANG